MVINNDPCYAYLLEGNSLVDQKIVMAHVYAHCDFFKNNLYFKDTNRKMMNEMANHGTRVRRYMAKHGVDEVENFIDTCLSLENLIDLHAPMITRRPSEVESNENKDQQSNQIAKLPVQRGYLETYINPAEYIEQQKQKLTKQRLKAQRFPLQPDRDVLLFLMEHAPLKRYQRDIMGIIREEAYYFAPQAQTKIMNEGWASYWHSTIMTQRALRDDEFIDYADHHSGTMAMRPGSLNPYKIGLELFRDIEERWNKGQFGKEWDECNDYREKERWDKKLGLGRQKIFEVRQMNNDITFLDNYLTHDFCRKHKLFTYDYNKRNNFYEITSRQFSKIKQTLLFQLTNFGQPIIYVSDGNYMNRSEMLLWHKYEGMEIQINLAKDVLKNIFQIWQRPVNLETVLNKKKVLLTYNGKEHIQKTLE